MSQDYSNLDNPYNSSLMRGADSLEFQLGGMTKTQAEATSEAQPGGNTAASNTAAGGAVQQASASNGGAFADLAIESSIYSKNWAPRTTGFYINGQTGYAEFANLYIKGGVISSRIDIPDQTSTDSFHTDAQGNSWWGSANFATAPASISKEGNATFNSGTFSGTFKLGDTQITLEAGATAQEISDALTTINNAGGGILFFGQGTTTLTENLSIPDNTIISGVSGSIIDLNGLYQINAIGTNTYGTGTVTISNGGTLVTGSGTTFTSGMVGRYILLEDFWYEITAFNSTTSLTINSTRPYYGTDLVGQVYAIATTSKNVGVRNLTIKNSTTHALDFEYVDSLELRNLIVSDIQSGSVTRGVYIRTSSKITIDNISFERCDYGIYSSYGRYAELSNMNFSSGVRGAYFVNSRNWKLSTMNISSTSSQGIYLDAVCTLMTVDSFSVNNTGAGSSGITINTGATSNIIFTSGTVQSAGNAGLTLNSGNTNIQIIGCQFINNQTYGVNITSSGCIDTVVTGNYARSNGSGDILDLGTRTTVLGNSQGFLQSPQISRVTTAFSKTSDASLQAIPGLSAIVKAGKAYVYELQLWLTSTGGSGGFSTDMNGGTATMTSIVSSLEVANDAAGGTVTVFKGTSLAGSGLNSAGTGAAMQRLYRFKGHFVVNAAGTFKPRFSQQTSDATACTVGAGSYLKVEDSDTYFNTIVTIPIVSDTLGAITENVTMFIPTMTPSKAEVVTVTDVPTILIPSLKINLSESITVTEFLDSEYAIPKLWHDNVFIQEFLAISAFNYAINQTENINVTEDIQLVTKCLISVSDSVTVSENVTNSVENAAGTFGAFVWGAGGGAGNGGTQLNSSSFNWGTGGSGGSAGAFVENLTYLLPRGSFRVVIGQGGQGGQGITGGAGGTGYKTGGNGGARSAWSASGTAGSGGGGGGSTLFHTIIAAGGAGGAGGVLNTDSSAVGGAPTYSGTNGGTGASGSSSIGNGAGGGGAAATDGTTAVYYTAGAGGTGATTMTGTVGGGGTAPSRSAAGSAGGSSAGISGNGSTGPNSYYPGASGSGGAGPGADGTGYDSGGGGNGGGGSTTGVPGAGGNGGTPGGGAGGSGEGFTTTANGGTGGNGKVIVVYDTAALSGYTITGGTITTDGSNTVHTFTSDGYFTIV